MDGGKAGNMDQQSLYRPVLNMYLRPEFWVGIHWIKEYSGMKCTIIPRISDRREHILRQSVQ